MSSKFFTNKDENTLLNKIEGVFKHKNIFFLDALVGYFRASGYFKIRKFIDSAEEIRILVGINVDNLIHEANQQGVFCFRETKRKQNQPSLSKPKKISRMQVMIRKLKRACTSLLMTFRRVN
ncbi:MAG: hypothetical protein ACOCVX_04285 [Bacteroidales bacterium]